MPDIYVGITATTIALVFLSAASYSLWAGLTRPFDEIYRWKFWFNLHMLLFALSAWIACIVFIWSFFIFLLAGTIFVWCLAEEIFE